MAETLPFEDDATSRSAPTSEPALHRRRRRLRRPARPPARARAPPEGRPRPDLDPGARRAVPRLHRGGAAHAPRARGRLSRDGGLARLPEVAPAAARAAEGRGARAPPTSPTALALRLRRLEAMREAARKLGERDAARPRRLRPRRAGAGRDPQEPALARRRSTTCSSAYARQRQKQAQLPGHPAQAPGLVPDRSARGAGAPGRPAARLGVPRRYLLDYMAEPAMRATVLASAFSATLEMVREGQARCSGRTRPSRRSGCSAPEPRRGGGLT